MFCKDCGADLAKGCRFCPHCGCEQAAVTPAAPVDFADKVRSTAKKAGSSTAFLIATICLTFAQLLNLLMPEGSAFDVCFAIFSYFGADGLRMPAASEYLYLAANAIRILPRILITLGLWITFFSCAGRKTKVNTSGLTMIFVVTLVQMVVSCLVLLAACIPLAAMYTGADAVAKALFYGNAEIIQAIALGVGVALLVVFIFALIYYCKVCATISNIRSTLKTGVPNRKVSRFVAILRYLSGGILILSGFFTLFTGILPLDSYYDKSFSYGQLPFEIFLSAVTSLLTATAHILFGALIFTYRRRMKALEEEDRLSTFQTLSYAEPYTAPVYIPPEPEAAPAAEEICETKRWDL